LQRALHADVAAGREGDVWIAVEHDPVVTIGRQGKTNSLLVPPETLRASGIEVHEIERGGDVTYHGPGQVVIYPIMRLPRFREIVPLVRQLEEAAIAACARYGVTAERWSAHAGAWVGQNCICAIGLAVQKMTSLHGIALNASTALDYDRLINPCGLVDRGITSLSHETGRLVSYDDAKDVLLGELSRVFDVTFVKGVIPSDDDLALSSRAQSRDSGAAEDRRKAS